MSWTLSASGHAALEADEQVLLADLKELFSRYVPKGVVDAVTFSGSGGSFGLADLVAKEVVVPLVREVDPNLKTQVDDAAKDVAKEGESLADKVEGEVDKLVHHNEPPAQAAPA